MIDKAIASGKERRKQYRGTTKAKAHSTGCRNHGSCTWCLSNRTHKHRRNEPADEKEMRDEAERN